MSPFKFVCRENEIQEVLTSLKEKPLVTLTSLNNSGITHFLKYLSYQLWQDNAASFYIDGYSQMTISEQVIGQIMTFSKDASSKKNDAAKLLKQYGKKDVVYAIATSCLFALDSIPIIPDIGTIANSLISSIRETVDVDYAHLADFKKEKAIGRLCEKLSKKGKDIYFLIDNTSELNFQDVTFLSLLIERYNAHVLFTFNANDNLSLGYPEFFSKFHAINSNHVFSIPLLFQRPDNNLIESLYRCYNASFYPEKFEIFERHNRNIHIIMADIWGESPDIFNSYPEIQYLLKVLKVLDCAVSKDILFDILRAEKLENQVATNEYLYDICQQAIKVGVVRKELNTDSSEERFILEPYFRSFCNVKYLEQLNITQSAIKVLDGQIKTLNASLLEFAISNLEHDYSHRKEYILALAELQNRHNHVPLNHLDKLSSFDDCKELIFVVGQYYNCGIYDKPYSLLLTHKNFSRNRFYKIALAMILERLHRNDYVKKLETLYHSAKNLEEKCLLSTILFVAYLNSDWEQKYKVFFQSDSQYYYKNFKQCKNYPYLLRNVSYYIIDVNTAMKNYEFCLNTFKNKDIVSYNRTISNYFCYLMRNSKNKMAKMRLDQIANEVRLILDYSDPAYNYLNINYGIYLMNYTEEDPSSYFLSIPFSTGTTETPYIYAQINLAVYYLKINPYQSLKQMDYIANQVSMSSVPRTKQFYAINRAVVEYANHMYPKEQLSYISAHPLRGDVDYAKNLCQKYQQLANNGFPCDWETLKMLILPGYIFYRYFKAEKLLSDFCKS